jgi:quinol monooxygenase YgiN
MALSTLFTNKLEMWRRNLMFVRVVKLTSKPGMEGNLRKIGREVLIDVNKEAGCEDVYFLEPEGDSAVFGVVSIWKTKEVLEKMRKSEAYQRLLQDLAECVDETSDELFVSEA